MKQIYVTLSPVSPYQTLTVYEEGRSSSTKNFQLPELGKEIFSIADIDKITLIGNKQYIEKFEEELKRYEKTKYGLNKIQYKIVEG